MKIGDYVKLKAVPILTPAQQKKRGVVVKKFGNKNVAWVVAWTNAKREVFYSHQLEHV